MAKIEKTALRSFPRPTVTTAMRKRSQEEDARKGVATTERTMIGGEDTLVVNLFAKDQKALVPKYRIFCQMDGDITQRLDTDKVRWKQGSFWNLTDGWYSSCFGYSHSPYPCVTTQDKARVRQFFEDYQKLHPEVSESMSHEDYEAYIYAYQADIRRRRNVEKNRPMFEHVDAQMAMFGDLPEDYETFVNDTVFAGYDLLFYSKKANHAYCTHCGKEFNLHDEYLEQTGLSFTEINPKHNEYLTCPHCGRRGQAKSEGYSRGKMIYVRWTMLVQNVGQTVLVRYIRHIRDFREDYKNPKNSTKELYRTVHEKGRYEDYEYGQRHISGGYGWRYPYKPSPWWNPSEYEAPREVVCYNTSWEVLNGTYLQYSCTDLWMSNVADKKLGPWAIDQWWMFYQKYPFVEQFMKVGWYGLIDDIYYEYGRASAKSFDNGKDICKTLKMARAQFLFLRSATNNNPRMIDIEIMRYAAGKGVKMVEDDHKMLRVICKNRDAGLYRRLIDLGEYASMSKIIRWLMSQGQNFHLRDYLDDYLKWAKDLGYDLHLEANLLPAKFYRRHDALQIEYCNKQDEIKAAEFRRFNQVLAEIRKDITDDNPANMHAQGLMIRAPYELEELRKEGEQLHHCVATYMDRVAKGKTMIFFIRQETKPDIPYYTLEWNEHRVVQCRGKNNCDMTPEVKAFTKVFSEKMAAFELQAEKDNKKAKAV